jgi:hypothetical protein
MAAITRRKRTGRYLVLLICILLMFTISPLVAPLHHGVLMLNIVGAAVVVAGSYAVGKGKSRLVPVIVLSAASIAFTWWLSVAPSRASMIASHTSLAVLISFFVVNILGYVLRDDRITADKIYAAICVYLLAGYGWAFAYALLEESDPGAFSGPVAVEAGDHTGRIMGLRYFSFVTLTTVGYGDIVPRSPAARTMATLEAVMGQLYLVALVGRLVGLHIVHSDRLGPVRSKQRDR